LPTAFAEPLRQRLVLEQSRQRPAKRLRRLVAHETGLAILDELERPARVLGGDDGPPRTEGLKRAVRFAQP
jgi:hypothetical protein